MDKYTQPHISSAALITIDTQNDFTLDDAPVYIGGTKEIIANMTRLLALFRQHGLSIVHVVRFYDRDGSNAELCRRQRIAEGQVMLVPGSEGAELVQELKPNPGMKLDAEKLMSGKFQKIGTNEFVMYKPRWGAFYRTGLEAFLRARTVDTLLFCGCNYPNCPRTSIYEASERDFRVVLVKDAVSQLYPKAEEEMDNIGVKVLSTDQIEAMFI